MVAAPVPRPEAGRVHRRCRHRRHHHGGGSGSEAAPSTGEAASAGTG
jgi:hypothetical protein